MSFANSEKYTSFFDIAQMQATPPATPCHAPLLSAKSFFLSLAICTGIAALLYSINWLLWLQFKIRHPRSYYGCKLGEAVLEMKKVIHLEENGPGGFYDGRGSQNARQHLLFCLRHIDTIPWQGEWPDVVETLGELAYVKPVIADPLIGRKVDI